MEDLLDPEEKILCPYDPSHHIRRCRMSFHLVKCRKNFGEKKMVPCDFNVTHLVPESELPFHHQTCPDRRKVEAQIVESTTSSSEERFPIPKFDDFACEENWDNEDVPTYDPKKHTENRDVLRQLDVESGAKRKNFRLNERQRLNGMAANYQPPTPKEPMTHKIELPSHRPVSVTANEHRTNNSSVQQRLKLGTGKIVWKTKNDN